MRAATAVALAAGAAIVEPQEGRPQGGPQRVEWDIASRCSSPVVIEQAGEGHYQLAPRVAGEAVWQPNRFLTMRVPCRKCAACLAARRARWARAGAMEWQRAEAEGARTWFGTLTIKPELRFRLLTLVRQRLGSSAAGGGIRPATGLDALEPRDQFRELAKVAQPLATNFLKALRKGRKAAGIEPVRFRYMLVVEPHLDWFPHFHVQMHEVSPLMPLRKRSFGLLWPHGFVQWRLAHDPGAAGYVAKYLAKESFARVRASIGYGDEWARPEEQGPKF